jgi:hypothetical protein
VAPAGSPCPIEVMKRVQSQMNMGEVTIACSMTETSPVSTLPWAWRLSEATRIQQAG